MSDGVERAATISECGLYRYDLRRTWDPEKRPALFIMLNPSTADASVDDPTVRRCMAFARSWGCGGVVVVNLFALRATDPDEMKRHPAPVGPENYSFIRKWAEQTDTRVAAWGVHGRHRGRDAEVLRMFDRWNMNLPLSHLGLTKGGHPKHPLYLKADTKPQPFGG